ncbi:hypothetical protein [Pelagibaculum spongiae]|uniref:Uncharacterized protein n=1 Tax=Pelagibaculum spongiae TaxID=2080658 RepID=A0A2V1H332_9GAMM|nr:hypothetical protein [Pelagibaculum spongiae]PVZ69707.1 hypothetical protein DC094_10425 [Pelagibaculum spongiae]
MDTFRECQYVVNLYHAIGPSGCSDERYGYRGSCGLLASDVVLRTIFKIIKTPEEIRRELNYHHICGTLPGKIASFLNQKFTDAKNNPRVQYIDRSGGIAPVWLLQATKNENNRAAASVDRIIYSDRTNFSPQIFNRTDGKGVAVIRFMQPTEVGCTGKPFLGHFFLQVDFDNFVLHPDRPHIARRFKDIESQWADGMYDIVIVFDKEDEIIENDLEVVDL